MAMPFQNRKELQLQKPDLREKTPIETGFGAQKWVLEKLDKNSQDSNYKVES